MENRVNASPVLAKVCSAHLPLFKIILDSLVAECAVCREEIEGDNCFLPVSITTVQPSAIMCFHCHHQAILNNVPPGYGAQFDVFNTPVFMWICISEVDELDLQTLYSTNIQIPDEYSQAAFTFLCRKIAIEVKKMDENLRNDSEMQQRFSPNFNPMLSNGLTTYKQMCSVLVNYDDNVKALKLLNEFVARHLNTVETYNTDSDSLLMEMRTKASEFVLVPRRCDFVSLLVILTRLKKSKSPVFTRKRVRVNGAPSLSITKRQATL